MKREQIRDDSSRGRFSRASPQYSPTVLCGVLYRPAQQRSDAIRYFPSQSQLTVSVHNVHRAIRVPSVYDLESLFSSEQNVSNHTFEWFGSVWKDTTTTKHVNTHLRLPGGMMQAVTGQPVFRARTTALLEEMDKIEWQLKNTEILFSKASLQALQPMTESNDDEELVRALFNSIDVDRSGVILASEIEDALERFKDKDNLALNLRQLLLSFNPAAGTEQEIRIHYEDFSRAIGQLPRVRGERVRWARSLNLEGYLAPFLPHGDIFDGLGGLRRLEGASVEAEIRHICDRFAAVLPHVLRQGLEELRPSAVPQAAEEAEAAPLASNNSKFVLDPGSTGRFATLDDFFRGPQSLIGAPSPNVYEGAEKEHTTRKNAGRKFTAPNYNVTTWPAQEWEFVVAPRPDTLYPHTPKDTSKWDVGCDWKGPHGREVVLLDYFMQDELVGRARLSLPEVVCLRLYTGPMFILYNASLRGFPAWQVECLKDPKGETMNKYETTIFTIASGITKLAKVTGIPKDRKLYRGLGGMILPKQFWTNFEECQVAFTVETSSHAQAGMVQDILVGQMKYKMARSSLEALQRMDEADLGHTPLLDLLSASLLEVDEKAQSDEKTIELDGLEGELLVAGQPSRLVLRVVSPARKSGNACHMEVAVPVSRFMFTSRLQDRFKACVRGTCGNSFEVQVVIDNVADKPKDFKGGVEFGLVSTTTAKETAYDYSGADKHRGTIFEIQSGRIDIGASIKFLSQYPGEDEYLMQPLSCLEVMDEPRTETTKSGKVVIIPLRVNVNLKGATVDDLQMHRKELHTAMTANLREDLQYAAESEVVKYLELCKNRRSGILELLRSEDEAKVQVKYNNQVMSLVGNIPRVLLGAPQFSFSEGKVFFEIEVIEAQGDMFVGVRGSSSQAKWVGADEASWSIHSSGKAFHRAAVVSDHTFGSWFRPGGVLGLAVSTETGTMSLSVDGGTWTEVAFASAVRPGLAVGGCLLPAICCAPGVQLVCRFGSGGIEPLMTRPPTPDYRLIGRDLKTVLTEIQLQGSRANNTVLRLDSSLTDIDDTDNFDSEAQHNEHDIGMLRLMGVYDSSLLDEFQLVCERHSKITASDFNQDQIYKDTLNEILNTKLGLLSKQQSFIMLLREGAKVEQLLVCVDSPVEDFVVNFPTLTEQCRLKQPKLNYTWKSVLTGWYAFVDEIVVPLDLPACMIALVWYEILAFKNENKKVMMNEVHLTVSDLVPQLRVKSSRLHSSKFGTAIVGLVLASNAIFDKNKEGMLIVTRVELSDIEFRAKQTDELSHAVAAGCLKYAIIEVNGLRLIPRAMQLGNLRDAISRNLGFSMQKISSEEEFSESRSELSSTIRNFDLEHVEDMLLPWFAINGVKDSEQISTLNSDSIVGLDLLPVDQRKIKKLINSFKNQDWGSLLLSNSSTKEDRNELLRHLSRNGLGRIREHLVAVLELFGVRNVEDLQHLVGDDVEQLLGPEDRVQNRLASTNTAGAEEVDISRSERERFRQLLNSFSQGPSPAVSNRFTKVLAKELNGAAEWAFVLARLTKISCTILDMSNNDLDAAAARWISPGLALLVSLTSLILRDNNIGPDGATALSKNLTSLTTLNSLSLEGNEMFTEGWNAVMDGLERLSSLSQLNGWSEYQTLRHGDCVALDLASQDFSAKELGVAVARLLPRSASTLTRLDLSFNGFGPIGGSVFADKLRWLTCLTSLNFSHNRVGREVKQRFTDQWRVLRRLGPKDPPNGLQL